jgi:hypothetical protein
MRFSSTKAGKYLRVAHATYKRGEKKLARDIFVLAMEEPDVDELLEEEPIVVEPSEEDLKAQLAQAIDEDDMDKAKEVIDQLQNMKEEVVEEPEVEIDEELEEPEVEIDEEPAFEEDELPAAQVAQIVTLAQKIKKAGHDDLAKKITAALGL